MTKYRIDKDLWRAIWDRRDRRSILRVLVTMGQPELFAAQETGFVAWRRQQGQRWKPVAEGATEREASDRLFEIMKRSGSGTFDSVILKIGEKP
jgi:hypothetical protein